MWVIAPFVLLPVIEIVLFIQIGGAIGVWAVLGLLLLSAVAGVLLMKWTGMQAMADLRSGLERGINPAKGLVDRALTLAAAVLLILPGFFSDAGGLLLLLPPVRGLIWRWLQGRVAMSGFTVQTGAGRGRATNEDVIDGEFRRVEPEDPELPRH